MLPTIHLEKRVLEEADLKFVEPTANMQLAIYVDAAQATGLRIRHSISGLVATLNGTANAYRAKWQPTVSTSYTEAEFIAVVSASKMAKNLRYFLEELGVEQHGPTMIYEENVAAILMMNAGKPTEHSHHIDIQYFALK